jgi:hypothetical protein
MIEAYLETQPQDEYCAHGHLRANGQVDERPHDFSLLATAGALTAVKIRCDLKLVLMLLLQRFLYAPLLYWVAAGTILIPIVGCADSFIDSHVCGAVIP